MKDINDVIDRFADLFPDLVDLRESYDKEARENLIFGDYKKEQIAKEKAEDINEIIDMYEEDLERVEKLYED